MGGTLVNRQLCPPGAYCPGNNGNPIYCPDGTRSNQAGQISSSVCEPCPAGIYCYNNGNTNGWTCPMGYFCPVRTAAFFDFPCPAGTFSNMTGLVQASQCLTCIQGHYCDPGSSNPMPCPPGTYSNQVGVGSQAHCLPCHPGFSCPKYGATEVTEPCSAGHYCPARTQFATQYPCPPGTFTNSINLTKSSECTDCFAGYSCDFGSTSNDMVMKFINLKK